MKSIKIKKQIPLSITILLLGFVSGCESFVTVDIPPTQLTTNTVFQEYATATAAMTDIYSKLRDRGLLAGNGSGMNVALGAYADELDYYGGTANGTNFFYNNTVLATDATVQGWWSDSYNQIYAANAVYEGAKSATKLTQNQKDLLTGEALFVRALLHSYLVNIFGDIPYITTTNYQLNQVASKKTVSQVYEAIIKDLKEAQLLLPTNYTGSQRIRPNHWTATALLAKMLLYTGNYSEAISTATQLIDQSAIFTLETNLDNVFLKESQETIWHLIPQVEGRNTDEGATLIFNAGPPTFVALRNDLVNSFETGDLRKNHWIKAITNGTSVWYHANKYKQRNRTATTSEYAVVLRLSEQYLIRAEAKAQWSDLEGARQDLNIIRNRAGLANTLANSKTELLDAILKERKVELFTESAHRFFDLKRSVLLNASLGSTKPGWNPTDETLPLPESEILLNPNLLPQNPGY